MSNSLFGAVVPSYIQMLGVVSDLIRRADSFAGEREISPSDLIERRLAPDMLPFGYQIKACAEHSAGAIDGVRNGAVSPTPANWPNDFAGLSALIENARADLQAAVPMEIDSLSERRTIYTFRDLRLMFSGERYLLSFAQPSFYFHASISYAILRAAGVKLVKLDFLGELRVDCS